MGNHSPGTSGRILGILYRFGRKKHGIHHGVPRKSMLATRVLQEAGTKHSASAKNRWMACGSAFKSEKLEVSGRRLRRKGPACILLYDYVGVF